VHPTADGGVGDDRIAAHPSRNGGRFQYFRW